MNASRTASWGSIAAAATEVASHQVKVRLDVGPMSVADPLPLTSLLDEEHTSPNSSNSTDQGDTRLGRTGSRRSPAADAADTGGLDVRYTFDAFVIGSSNRFAHAAAQAVAEMPAKSYNPLFIHGDAGLGKTHLLHAIGNYVRENFAGRRVRYVSTETFLNEFVDAIRNNTTMAFKRRYRECDVLLIDDVQFMENKEALQEEFFHTFNHLYGASRQVVLTSDRPPKSIATLEDRLRSRFLSGLITDVQPPELETRLAILQKKLEHEPSPCPPRGPGLHRLERHRQHPRARRRAHQGDRLRQPQQPAPHPGAGRARPGRHRQRRPAPRHHPGADPRHHRRDLRLQHRGTVRAKPAPALGHRPPDRHVPRSATSPTTRYPAIAKEFGGRDHTTVMHAVVKIQSLMKERRQIFDQVNDLIVRIRSGA